MDNERNNPTSTVDNSQLNTEEKSSISPSDIDEKKK
jgi:hypothetical protein